jgi:hypothetical protein
VGCKCLIIGTNPPAISFRGEKKIYIYIGKINKREGKIIKGKI